MASILFVYPPTADPTGPYLSIPYLAAACQARGHRTHALDLNLEAYLDLFTTKRLAAFAEDCRSRLRRMPDDGLPFPLSTEFLALSLAVHDAGAVAQRIPSAIAGLRERERFLDARQYDENCDLLQRALALISARFHPLELSFTTCHSPFHLNDAREIERETLPEHNPFHRALAQVLAPEVERLRPDAVGISATFNSQLLQAFAAGKLVKESFPETAVIIGGAAITQLALRCDPDVLAELRPFADLLVLFEGESTLCRLLDQLDAGRLAAQPPPNVLQLGNGRPRLDIRPTTEDIDALPTPDYRILPLDRYLSPEPLLHVAPTRGCYWQKCAFCHYGLTATGTATYRRRDLDLFVRDLEVLRDQCGARYFYFAGDVIDPAYLLALAGRLIERRLDIRFTSDLRAERFFTRERCRKLRQAGMVSAAFGTESDSPRLLRLMGKGTDPEANRQVFEAFSSAGIAVQAMAFLDFPTETAAEAHATLDLLEQNADRIDLFFVEEFNLQTGSRVFREPERYDVAEVFFPAGDRYRFHARFTPAHAAKRPEEYRDLLQRLDRLASQYGRRPYPYAGSVSVAHTLFYFDALGRDVFKRSPRASGRAPAPPRGGWLESRPLLAPGLALCDWPYDLEALAEHAGEVAEELERRREIELRDVGRATYETLAAAVPPVYPKESYYLLPATGAPVSIPVWLWMLASCLDGETTVREAAAEIGIPAREAAEGVEALISGGYLTLLAGATATSRRAAE